MSVGITIDVRDTALLAGLRKAEKRITYAIVNTLNETAKAIQEKQRAAVSKTFTLRKRDFVLRQAAVINPFASVRKGIMQAVITVGETRGKPTKRLLLAGFETGARREPFTKGATKIAVPTPSARPTRSSSVPQALHVRSLKLRRGRKGRRKRGQPGKRPVARGLLGTYVVPHVGIFQRRNDRTRLLYSFEPPFKLDVVLGFVRRANDTALRAAPLIMREQVRKTLAFAKGRA